MPVSLLPLIYGAIGGAVGVEVVGVAKWRIKKAIDERWREWLQAALDDLGIVIDPEEGINDASLTRAINDNLLAGSGIELQSVLDRKKMLKGFEGIALQRISSDLGLAPVESVGEIRGAIQAWLVDTLGEEIAAEAGEVLDDAKPLASVMKRIENAPAPKPWNEITDFSPEGVDNRARQARYRATHSKVWIQRV